TPRSPEVKYWWRIGVITTPPGGEDPPWGSSTRSRVRGFRRLNDGFLMSPTAYDPEKQPPWPVLSLPSARRRRTALRLPTPPAWPGTAGERPERARAAGERAEPGSASGEGVGGGYPRWRQACGQLPPPPLTASSNKANSHQADSHHTPV